MVAKGGCVGGRTILCVILSAWRALTFSVSGTKEQATKKSMCQKFMLWQIDSLKAWQMEKKDGRNLAVDYECKHE